MENVKRNEMEIQVGPEKILLRPTFENLATLEAKVGSLSYLGWKFSRGVRVKRESTTDFKMDRTLNSELAKDMPSLTEVAQIIYICQASTDPQDINKKKFSIEQIWDLVIGEGTVMVNRLLPFLAKLCAGNKLSPDELSESEKKN